MSRYDLSAFLYPDQAYPWEPADHTADETSRWISRSLRKVVRNLHVLSLRLAPSPSAPSSLGSRPRLTPDHWSEAALMRSRARQAEWDPASAAATSPSQKAPDTESASAPSGASR